MTKTAFLCIQCKTPDQSETGTFLVFGDKGQPYATCTLASPVHPDLASLSPWLEANGWKALPREADWPVGRYSQEETEMDTTFADANLAPGAAALFVPVLDWLDNYDPAAGRGFNLSHYIDKNEEDFDGNTCGTVCCIAGAIEQFNGEWVGQQSVGKQYWAESTNLYVISDGLGLTTAQRQELFFAKHEGYDEMYSMVEGAGFHDHVTPSMAAATIRRFLATGEIRWIWGE